MQGLLFVATYSCFRGLVLNPYRYYASALLEAALATKQSQFAAA